MIGSSAFNYINILDKAADATWQRNQLISNNIANVDTPNYKRKDIRFEEYLMMQLSGGESLDSMVNQTDLNALEGMQFVDGATLNYRLDGNNVSIDTETAYLAKNQLKYNALVDSMMQEFSRIKSVLT